MSYTALDSRVAKMLRVCEYVILFWVREWSTCLYERICSFIFGLDSGQHVDIIPMFAIALELRLVNMLRFYEHVLLFWIREWSTC